MEFPNRYEAAATERRWQEQWAAQALYQFNPADPRPIFSIDTPPPTVSGQLHMGHIYSYTQAEAMARFWRMQGYSVYYPFGFDDNGLPTERFVEREMGRSARQMGRDAFVAACLQLTRQTEDEFEQLWRSLGFSVDWSLRYATIDDNARRIAQWSFIDLYRKGRIYRTSVPNPWCPECQTAVAQAEMDDAERETTYYTLNFRLQIADYAVERAQSVISVATTRPELLPACVAVFVHPDDRRYTHLIGGEASVPLFQRCVPILADALVDPAKGTGAVMCCTFGDQTDVAWWKKHNLPLLALLRRDGTLSDLGGAYAGMNTKQARARITHDLAQAGLLTGNRPAPQTVRVHERCGTPLEILESSQWFVRLLDEKPALLELGRRIAWYPAHMRARYEHWVQNLAWDWAISRQRFFGVPFPAWHCASCDHVLLAHEDQLPFDPQTAAPPETCPQCGGSELRPDADVMDTWMTSSLSPQISGQLFTSPELYARLFPMALRPQAHDIIRTWAFYTIVKSYYHFGELPWQSILISGHGLTASGEKQSKSKFNATSNPTAVIARYGADAVRYWACDGAPGSDQIVSEERMRDGQRLLNKLWSAARFAARFVEGLEPHEGPQPHALPTDRALLSRLDRLIEQATMAYRNYDYAAAKALTERFFWHDLCDSYLELAKGRLYGEAGPTRDAARHTLSTALLAVLKLLAPVLPHITEELHSRLWGDQAGSLHLAAWPATCAELRDQAAERAWDATQQIVAATRRFKTTQQRGMGTPLAALTLVLADSDLTTLLEASSADILSATRAARLEIQHSNTGQGEELAPGLWLSIEA